MNKKKIIIIGGGIAGLSAGCYGQMNGYDTQIFEMHTLPGGLCTSWEREGYVFDGCIHWLVGSNSASSSYQIWHELGALKDSRVIDHEIFAQRRTPDGKVFSVFSNLDKFEQHLKELSPQDSAAIDKFIKETRALTRLEMPLELPNNLLKMLKMFAGMLPLLPKFRKWGRISTQDFVSQFKDPTLREHFQSIFDMPDFPMIAMMMTLAWLHNKNAGYPIGGSLAFSQNIEKRYQQLEGILHYGSKVIKVLIKDDHAVGIRLEDGSEYYADTIISAADGYNTIYKMLDGKYIDETIQGYYENNPIFPPIIQVSMGINRNLSDLPPSISYVFNKPFQIANREETSITLRQFCYDPTIAPAGKSAVTVMFQSNYDYWKGLAEDRERYDAEKKQIGITVIEKLNERIPGLADTLEVIDVATPLTTERYTGNWKGSMEGWLVTTRNINMAFGNGMKKTLPGLENFYMAGQWVEPGGGIPTAAISARALIKRLCKQDKKRFVTTTVD